MRARPLVLAAAGIATAALLAGCAGSSGTSSSGHQMDDGSMMSGASMSATPSPSTVTGSGIPLPSNGNAGDIGFAQSMIPHHEQAIEMAELALAGKSAASPQVRALAERIKAAQDPEIAQMTAWLREWGAPTAMPSSSDMAGMDHGSMDMSGMMSEKDMAALSHAHGEEFDRTWLQMMIVHHQGAVSMAQQVLATTANPDVQALAQAVIDGQTAEIAQMKGLLP